MYSNAVLFDLDGVILDTEGIYTDFWAEIGRRYSVPVDDFAHVIKGNTLARIFDTYFPNESDREEIRHLLKEQELTMEYRPFPGALELMEGLHKAGIATAIVTSSNAVKMQHIFERLPQLAALTDVLITDEDVTHSKPHPQGYLSAAEGLDAEQFMVVEDSLAGIEAGHRAGAKVVGLATTCPREKVEAAADFTFNSIAEIKPEFFTVYFSTHAS
ncbi:MAG: HAD family hydrolase [Muribaculaceae bacterium]